MNEQHERLLKSLKHHVESIKLLTRPLEDSWFKYAVESDLESLMRNFDGALDIHIVKQQRREKYND